MADNCEVPSDPESESSHRDYKHGHFYDGNITRDARKDLAVEGSETLAINQGFVRVSLIPEQDPGFVGQDNNKRIPTLVKQGSHSQLQDPTGHETPRKVSREI